MQKKGYQEVQVTWPTSIILQSDGGLTPSEWSAKTGTQNSPKLDSLIKSVIISANILDIKPVIVYNSLVGRVDRQFANR